MSNKQQYSGSTIVDPSNDLSNFWADCPVQEIRANWRRGWFHDDDFCEMPLAGTQTTQIGYGKGKVFATSGALVAPVPSVSSIKLGGGNLQLLNAAANNRLAYAQAYGTFMMTGNVATGNTLWMEARISISSIVAAGIGFMLGLAEVDQWTLAAGVPFSTNSSDAITNSASFVGFRKQIGGLGFVDTVVSDRATTFTAIGSNEGVIAANTFVKLGMKYEPRDNVNEITFYVNGQKTATRYTGTQLIATTNLKANPLGLIIATIGDSAVSTNSVTMDWWKCYQLAP